MKKIKTWFKNYKKSLFTIDNRPLSKSSKILLIVYTIFMFILVSIGIDLQTKHNTIYKQYGYKCINLVNKYKDIKDREENLNRIVRNYNRYRYEWSYNDFVYNSYKKIDIKNNFGTNELCYKLGQKYYKVANDIEFKSRYKAIEKLRDRKTSLLSRINKLEDQYGNMLLEKMVNQPKEKSILSSNSNKVKDEITRLNREITIIDNKIDYLSNLDNLHTFKNFLNYLEKNYKIIENNYYNAIKWRSLKNLFSIYLYLIPLFLLFYFIYKIAKTKNRQIIAHLAINGANVVGIYILFYLIIFIYDIIPKTFLEKLFETLYKYGLQFIFSYFGIALFTIIFGFLIYKVEKNVREKVKKPKNFKNVTYIKNGLCTNCGSKIRDSYNFCPNCGENIFENCKYCNHKIIKGIIHCTNCGKNV